MEQTVIDFIFSTLASLAAQYPTATWIGILIAVLSSFCGLCAVATVWLPVPAETTGAYAALYRWVHALALHFGQNKGALADAKSEFVQYEVKAVTGK